MKTGDTTTMCILSKILYIYFEINVFKAQMGYGGTQKCKIKMISERFKTRAVNRLFFYS